MTIPTTDPVPSEAPQDLLFNAGALDKAINSAAPVFADRFGTPRMSLAGAISTVAAYNSRGPWASNTTYAAKDLVSSGGAWYMCLIGHTSGATFAGDLAAKWRLFQGLDGGVTVVSGNGIADNSAALAAAVAIGLPIAVKGVLHVASATTITVPLVDSGAQLFSSTSAVTINNGLPVRPEWFGAASDALHLAALSLAGAGGGTVLLGPKTYGPCGHTYGASGAGTGKYLGIDNLRIIGAGMPRLTNDCKALTGGSIIKGTLLLYANNVELRDIGVDAGLTVTDALYGGAAQDALMITYPDSAAKAAAHLRRGVKLHNVTGLARSPDALCHAVIAGEGVVDVATSGEVIGCMGLHGIVFKCGSVRAESVTAYCNNGEGVIIKSDAQATAVSSDVQVGRVTVRGGGPFRGTPHAIATAGDSLQLYALAGAIDKVQIGQAILSGHPVGVRALFGGDYLIRGVQIDSLAVDQYGVAGTRQAVAISATGLQAIKDWSIGRIEARNTDVGVFASFVQDASIANHLHIDHLQVTAAARALDVASQSYVDIGAVVANNISEAVYKITGTPALRVGTLFNASSEIYSASGLTPALSNGWAAVAGGGSFSVDLLGGRVSLRGLVKPGSSTVVATLPQWAWPVTVKRTSAIGRSGSVQSAVPVLISTAGVVSVNEATGGTANCTDWLSLDDISWS